MKESEMWRHIGEHIEEHGLSCSLCIDGGKLLANKYNIRDAYSILNARIKPHKEIARNLDEDVFSLAWGLHSTYAYPIRGNADARILATYWLALECEEEEKMNG